MGFTKCRMLVVAKAYPVIDQASRNEAVCVAGITVEDDPHWIRLFPLDFRGLGDIQKFPKYSVIEFEATKARRDPRPESMTPDLDSITVIEGIGADRGTWGRRLSMLRQVEAESMCQLQRGLKEGGSTLGFFPVKKVLDIVVEQQSDEFQASQAAVQAQRTLLGGSAADGDRKALQPIPAKFKYHYTCYDPGCLGHIQTIVDWELGALFRKLTLEHGEAEVERMVRDKFFADLCGPDREVWFIVGTMLRHKMSFIVLGVVSPKKDRFEPTGTLF